MAFSGDGSRMFVAGASADSVHEYALSAPFDVSTAGFVDSLNVTAQGTSPEGVAFSGDGYKMFVVDVVTSDVNEYALSAPFDVSAANHTRSFDVSSQDTAPAGVAFSGDGATMFVVGDSGNDISGYSLPTPFDVSVAIYDYQLVVSRQGSGPTGMAFSSDGAKVFVVDSNEERINEYALSAPFDIGGGSFVHSFSVSSQDRLPQGMAFSNDGAKMFVAGSFNGAVYEYSLRSVYPVTVTDSVPPTFASSGLDVGTGVLTMTFSEAIDATSVVPSKIHLRERGSGTGGVSLTAGELGTAPDSETVSFTLTPSHLEAARGMATPELTIESGAVRDTSGIPFAALDLPNLSNAAFVGSFDVSEQDTAPRGVAFSGDGSRMFVAGASADSVHEYALSAPFDVSTAGFVDSLNVTAQGTSPEGVAFSGDGYKMFVVDAVTRDVNEYALSAPFDVSTASHADGYNVRAQVFAPVDVAFSNGGFKMFVADSGLGRVIEYNLSAPFNITAAQHSHTFSSSAQEGVLEGLAFSGDGAKMFVVGQFAKSVIEYALSTPFDLSTASFANVTFPVSAQDEFPAGMAFSGDGSRMFVVGGTGDVVNEYTLSSAYPIRLTDSVPPTLVSSGLDIGTGALTMAFSEVIDAASVVHSKMHVRESGTYAGGVTLTAAELDAAAADGSTISFTLTPAHLEAVRGLATPELTIEPGAVQDAFGNPIAAPFDVSTARFAHSFDVSPQETLPRGMAFSSDGARMFVVGFDSDQVHEYALSAPFDASTASFVDSFDVSSRDMAPTGMAFSSDGTKMFVVGWTNNRIHEYALSAPFDVSAATFVDSFDVSSQDTFPTGVTFSNDGAKMFVVGSVGDAIYEYALSAPFDVSTAAFANVTFSVSSQDAAPTGVAFSSDGARMFVVGLASDQVHEYALSAPFDVSAATHARSFSVSSQDTSPTGVAFSSDGARMFVVGNSADSVHEYSLRSVYPVTVTDSRPPTLVSSGLDIGTGVLTMTFSEAIDAASVVPSKIHLRERGSGTGGVTLTAAELGTAPGSETVSFTLTPAHLEAVAGMATPELTIEPGAVQDASGNPIVATFDVSTASFIRSFDVSEQDTAPRGVAFSGDGSRMFVAGASADSVHEYALSAPFDVSTAGFVDSLNVTAQGTSPEGVAFSGDGYKMFVVDAVTRDVNEYALSAPFDVSTASHADGYNVRAQVFAPVDVAFSGDGFKMFVADSGLGRVIEYNLSAPFNITAAQHSHTFSSPAQEGAPEGLAFSGDGAKMFVVGQFAKSVIEYALSTPFDLSTASFANVTFPVSAQDEFPAGMAFSGDGSRMFVVGGTGDVVNEYTLSSAYPIRLTDSVPPTLRLVRDLTSGYGGANALHSPRRSTRQASSIPRCT